MRSLSLHSLAAMSLLSLAACATTTWQTDKYVAPNYAGMPKNIYVVLSLSDDPQAADRPTLDGEMHGLLASCGIGSKSTVAKASYVKSDTDGTLDLNAVSADLQDYQPDSILFLFETGKNELVSTLTLARRDLSRYYVASLIEMPAKTVVWKSNLYVTSSNGVAQYEPIELGQAMARDVVAYLVDDKILRTCPASVTAASKGSPTSKSEPSPEAMPANLPPFAGILPK